MRFIELFLIALGLSMDAFAVAVCKGLAQPRVTFKNALAIGLTFGLFQALMPVAGYYLASIFSSVITAYDHWIAFALLLLIGAKMIKDGLSKDEQPPDPSMKPGALLLSGLATSIDALAVGVSLAFMQVKILPAAGLIGVTTLLVSMLGMQVGGLFGKRLKNKAEVTGGAILILIGLKILLEHLGLLPF